MINWRLACATSVLLTAFATPISAQNVPGQNLPGLSPAAPGIGLTAEHKRTIYQEVGGEKVQKIPEGSTVHIGGGIPDSVMLNEMPVSVKDQIGVLRDFKFAKLPDEKIVIVDPAQRRVVDIVTPAEGKP